MEEKISVKKTPSWRWVIRIALFLGVLAVLIKILSAPLVNPDVGNVRTYRAVNGFYELEEDICDAVFIGSSRTYDFWNPVLAFERCGIRTYNYASAAQPLQAARYIVEEVLKTQPNASIVVNLDDIRESRTEVIHRTTDYMHFSTTKLKLINALCEPENISLADRVQYLLPIIQYHSRWQSLTEADIWKRTDGLLGTSYTASYLSSVEDETENLMEEGEAAELDDYARAVIKELVDYCNERGVRLLLTMTPQADIIPTTQATRTAMCNYAESLGATVLDMRDKVDEIQLDYAREFKNAAHTNIHGSFKYTAYIADWLVENWALTDKRGESASSRWVAASEKYQSIASPYLLPFEWQPENRVDLPAVQPVAKALPEGGVSLTFDTVEGAEGYTVYRKKAWDSAWQQLEDVSAASYQDPEGKAGYVYAAVPYTEKDGTRLYGKVDYAGVTAA